MLKVLHGADFHLDAPFRALPPHKAAQRRAEQRELLGRMAETVRHEGVDLVLLAGDLLDSDQIYGETAQILAQSLENMKVPVLIAPGNHDFWSARSPYARISWPENVYIFHTAHIEGVKLEKLGCTVYGAAFTASSRTDRVLEGFRAQGEGLQLMVLHGSTVPTDTYGPISAAEIAASGLDYLALGHIHAATQINQEGNTFWAYPGCPEGRGFDETGEKGVYLLEVDKGQVNGRFYPLCRRRYVEKTVDLDGRSAEEALRSVLPEGETPDCCRITLTGERGDESPDEKALEALAQPFYYSVTVRDRTRLRRALWDRADEDTLTGLFLQAMARRRDSARTEEEKAVVEEAVRFGLAALEHREDPR